MGKGRRHYYKGEWKEKKKKKKDYKDLGIKMNRKHVSAWP